MIITIIVSIEWHVILWNPVYIRKIFKSNKSTYYCMTMTSNDKNVYQLYLLYITFVSFIYKLFETQTNTNLWYLPFSTWTVTLLLFALLGLHWYWPESCGRALCINKNDVVVSPFSVITETPPRGES